MKNEIIPKSEIQEKYLAFDKKKKDFVEIKKSSAILKKGAVSIDSLFTAYTGEVTSVIRFEDGTSSLIIGKEKKIVTKSWLEG